MNITIQQPMQQVSKAAYVGKDKAAKTYLFAALIICINLIALL